MEAGSLSFARTVLWSVETPSSWGPWVLTFLAAFPTIGGSGRTYARHTAMKPLLEGREILMIEATIGHRSRKKFGKVFRPWTLAVNGLSGLYRRFALITRHTLALPAFSRLPAQT